MSSIDMSKSSACSSDGEAAELILPCRLEVDLDVLSSLVPLDD